MAKKAWRYHTSRARSRLVAALNRAEVDANALRIIPDGADKPGLPIPLEIEYTAADLAEMADLWDEINPDGAGLLTAPIINRPDDGRQA